jgi:hypothetical protein
MRRGRFIKQIAVSVPLAVLTVNNSFAFGSDFAVCAHPSHGSKGWTGPVRTGPDSNKLAWDDARQHNKDNPGHDAAV